MSRTSAVWVSPVATVRAQVAAEEAAAKAPKQKPLTAAQERARDTFAQAAQAGATFTANLWLTGGNPFLAGLATQATLSRQMGAALGGAGAGPGGFNWLGG